MIWLWVLTDTPFSSLNSHFQSWVYTRSPRENFRDIYASALVLGSSNSADLHVWMWTLDHKVSWAPKNWCFWIVVLEKTLESPLDCKEIKPVNPKGNQPLIFIGRTDAKSETPLLRPPDVKTRLIGDDHWRGPWCWERLNAEEVDNRGWDGWMASLTQWT